MQTNVLDTHPKIAIVTGGSRGLGRNTVLNLAKRGVDAILTYNTNRANAESVVRLVADAGRKAVALRLDVANVASFDAFVDGVRARSRRSAPSASTIS